MANPPGQSVIQRMARRGRARPRVDQGADARRAFQRAIRRAGAPFEGLAPEPQDDEMQGSLLVGDLLTGLPDGGLLVALDAPQGQRGLCLLQQPLVDALIEVQTTGRVDPAAMPARPFTKIDIALTRDFIDLLLAAFAAELDGVAEVDWPRRLSFGGPVADRRQLPLLLPDQGYHLFRVGLRVGDGAKAGAVVLAVPAGTGSAAAAEQAARKAAQDPAWKAAFHRALARIEVPLTAVVLRQRQSLAALDGLAPGDVLPFDVVALDQVRLEDRAGQAVLRGRLGRQLSKRAIRVRDGTVPEAVPPAPLPEADAPPDLPPETGPDGPLPLSEP